MGRIEGVPASDSRGQEEGRIVLDGSRTFAARVADRREDFNIYKLDLACDFLRRKEVNKNPER